MCKKGMFNIYVIIYSILKHCTNAYALYHEICREILLYKTRGEVGAGRSTMRSLSTVAKTSGLKHMQLQYCSPNFMIEPVRTNTAMSLY